MPGPRVVRHLRGLCGVREVLGRARRPWRSPDETGAVAVLFGLLALLLFVMAGLVVDLGSARDVRRQAQTAADASALAGADALFPNGSTPNFTAAVSAAQTYAAVNFGTKAADWTACTDPYRPGTYYVPSGSTPCISFDSSTAPTKVRVNMPGRTLTFGFGSLVNNGSSKMVVRAMAEAAAGTGSFGDCGFCVLGSSGTTTTAGGSSTLTVNNTSLYLNGRADISGNATVKVNNGAFKVQVAPQLSGSPNLSPTPTVTGVAVADPLAGYAMPSMTGLVNYGDINRSGNDTCNLQPGIYGNLTVSGSITCTFAAGLYVFTGSFNPSGSSTMDATSGVTLYFACGSPSAPTTCNNTGGGHISVSGSVTMKIKAPTSGSTKGMALLYDRGNTNNVDYTGTAGDLWYGSIYAASSNFVMGGTATSTNFDSMVVVKSLNLSGNASISTGYTVGNNVPAPSGGAALTK